jgi:acyl-CoA reductase-like NAD-dependent aldehyde dehydrogenase
VDGRTVGAVPWLDADAVGPAVDGARDAMQAADRRGTRRDPRPRGHRGAGPRRRVRGDDLRGERQADEAGPRRGGPLRADLSSAVEARSLAGRGIPLDAHPAGAGHLGFHDPGPVGVVAAITPFNFP